MALVKAKRETILVEISIDGSENSSTWTDEVTKEQLEFLEYLKVKSKQHVQSYGAVVNYEIL